MPLLLPQEEPPLNICGAPLAAVPVYTPTHPSGNPVVRRLFIEVVTVPVQSSKLKHIGHDGVGGVVVRRIRGRSAIAVGAFPEKGAIL